MVMIARKKIVYKAVGFSVGEEIITAKLLYRSFPVWELMSNELWPNHIHN